MLADKYRETVDVMHMHITQNVPEWKDVKIEQIEARKMAGLSNACYKVTAPNVPDLLYRKFACEVVDSKIETLIFNYSSNAGWGPKIYHATDAYRIEQFIHARPLTLWELRNPRISK